MTLIAQIAVGIVVGYAVLTGIVAAVVAVATWTYKPPSQADDWAALVDATREPRPGPLHTVAQRLDYDGPDDAGWFRGGDRP